MLDLLKYREIVPAQQTSEKWLDVVLNTGGTQSTLQDIKVAESAGGYSYKCKNDQINNRFIYWRTVQDVLELSEISLDANLGRNNIRFKFTDSPVLTVGIFETDNRIIVLVGTVNSIHRFFLPHPRDVGLSDDSILSGISVESAMDPSTFHLLGNTIGHGSVPHKASCWFAEQAYFAYAFASSLYVFHMDCRTGHVAYFELKISQMIPRILSNFSDVLRGKGNVDDTHYVTSINFDVEEDDNILILYALYRDNTLRMWSMKSGQCVSSINCAGKNDDRCQGTQNNALRKAPSSAASLMCVFLSYSTCSEFRLIKATGKGAHNYTMQIVGLIPAPQLDLVDFGISDDKIWGLWCNSEGETSISTYLINFNSTECWLACSLEPINEKTISTLEPGIDPKHMYCSNIFYPGRFQVSTILKALMMFCRSSNYIDINLSLNVLKDRVCQVIEQEIQNEIAQHDLSEEDEYLEVSEQFWSKFYSCCEQYQMAANQPIALFMLERSDVICIVKKQMISFLRPCDKFENFVLSGYCTEDLVPASQTKLRSDLEAILSVLTLLERTISDDIRAEIDAKLHRLQMPNVIISDILREQSMLNNSDEVFSHQFVTTLSQKMQGLHDIPATVMALLEFLRLDQHSDSADDMETDGYLAGRQFFSGNFGTSLITETVRQTSLVRFSLCRNLLILQQILVDNFTLNSTAIEVIRSQCIPETVVFLQAYYVMGWISTAATNFTSSQGGKNNSLLGQYNQPATLLQMFVKNRGIQTALKQFYHRKLVDNDNRWMNNLIIISNIIQQLIWAISGTFDFGEWLSNTNQTILIEEYVRLLNSWCEYNSCSRQFILAVSYLKNAESSKALDLFLECAKGINDETYLKQLIAPKTSTAQTSNEALAQYYLKIIKYFENQSCYDCVISISEIAIGTVIDKQQLAMFQSILFNNHLYLYHYEEAYHTIHECEPSRRKDCLRQLISYLFQEKRFDILIGFQYIGLEDELENIIETRARSMQIENNEHYEILYAFHMMKLNMRKASMVMYEKALRYTHESCSIESLEGRHQSLLSCVNTLSLVDKEYRWVVKPVIDDQPDEGSTSSGGESDDSSSVNDDEFKNHKQDVVVVELADIRKELTLVAAMLIVARTTNEQNQVYHMDADELIILLANEKYYTDAVNLAKQFKRPLTAVFKSLTLACIQASDGDFDSWNWIDNNDLSGIVISRNASDILWRFLKRIMEEECNDEHNYMKAITQQVLANDAFLPQWLMDAYKKKNASELIYQFILSGRIAEAAELSIEYINAFLGHGSDHFGFMCGTTTNPCFPVTVIDILLRELQSSAIKDEEYQENYSQLKQTVDYYLDNLSQSV